MAKEKVKEVQAELDEAKAAQAPDPSEAKKAPGFFMRFNVIHNGKSFSKGDKAPAEFFEFFKAQGFLEEK
jgi:hypothetical protein